LNQGRRRCRAGVDADAAPGTGWGDGRAIAHCHRDRRHTHRASIRADPTVPILANGRQAPCLIKPNLCDADCTAVDRRQSIRGARRHTRNVVTHDAWALCAIDSGSWLTACDSGACHTDCLRGTYIRACGAAVASLNEKAGINSAGRSHPVDGTRDDRCRRLHGIRASPLSE
jgi:hypothetical protein